MIFKIVASYCLFNMTEYFFHKLGHFRSRYNYIYDLHIVHHKEHYPATRLLSDKYRSRNEGIIAYTPPTIVLILFLFSLLDRSTFYHVFLQLLFHTITNDYIHTQIHTKNSWLERYKWFLESRRLHFIHHNKFTKNLSFGYDYSMDKLNGSYLKN